MIKTFRPHLEILPARQRAFWTLIDQVPPGFVLYGGTALALRLAHRASLDFDFFSADGFAPDDLAAQVPFLAQARYRQRKRNTVTAVLARPVDVVVSFFGGLRIAQVAPPERDTKQRVLVASLADLAATKLAVLPQRAEAKDYLDVAAILKTGFSLAEGLGCAAAVYGEPFNPMLTLKALCYFGDGDLDSVPKETQALLIREAAAVRDIPHVQPQQPRIASPLA